MKHIAVIMTFETSSAKKLKKIKACFEIIDGFYGSISADERLQLCYLAEKLDEKTPTEIVKYFVGEFNIQNQAPVYLEPEQPAMEQPFFHKKPSKPLHAETLPTVEPDTPQPVESLRERLFHAVQERKGLSKLTIDHLKQLNEAFRELDKIGTEDFDQQVTYLTFNCI